MDQASFEAIYSRVARPLWSYIRRSTGDPTLADDLLQETFFRFLRSKPETMAESEMVPYLYRIASNLMKDHWRKQQRLQRGRPGGAEPRVMGSVDGGSVDGEALGELFGQLNPRERSLLWLAYVEGMEHREIARALRLGERSIRVLLFRARKRLATLLKEKGIGGEDER